MDEDDESDTAEIRKNLLKHVTLPRDLPQEKPPRYLELKLMTHMVENVGNLSNYLPVKTVELLKRFRTVHLECTPDVISKEINSLRPGDTFAMFVRRQNTTIMVYMLPNDEIDNEESQNVILATFPGNLHPNQIYKAESDLEVFVFFYNCIQNTIQFYFHIN